MGVFARASALDRPNIGRYERVTIDDCVGTRAAYGSAFRQNVN